MEQLIPSWVLKIINNIELNTLGSSKKFLIKSMALQKLLWGQGHPTPPLPLVPFFGNH